MRKFLSSPRFQLLVLLLLFGGWFSTTPQAQNFSAQIQLALRDFVAAANTWTGTQTFQDVVVTGTCTGCGGGGSLPLQTLADPSDVLKNAAGDVVLKTDGSGNPLLQLYNGDSEVSGQFTSDAGGNGYPQVLDQSGRGFYFTADYIQVTGPGASRNFGLRPKGNGYLYTSRPFEVESSGSNASLTTALGVPNADLTWTETSTGQGGNSIQVEYVDDVVLSASYAAPVLTIAINTGVTTAQDILDLGAYDGAPVTVGLAPANDGTGIVVAMGATNLSGGLSVLNVTGNSWLDEGRITTDGSGNIAVKTLRANGGSVINNTAVLDGDNARLYVESLATDSNLDIFTKGAGTINLNSQVRVATSVDGSGNDFTIRNTSDTAGSGVNVFAGTTGDNATGESSLNLLVHETGANVAEFDIVIAGNSGNSTPDTTFIFPGAALFSGATSYAFDAVTIGTNFQGPAQVPVTAVGSLPTCDGEAEGTIRGVNDALLPAALAIVAAGGAVHVPVYCDSVNWRVM